MLLDHAAADREVFVTKWNPAQGFLYSTYSAAAATSPGGILSISSTARLTCWQRGCRVTDFPRLGSLARHIAAVTLMRRLETEPEGNTLDLNILGGRENDSAGAYSRRGGHAYVTGGTRHGSMAFPHTPRVITVCGGDTDAYLLSNSAVQVCSMRPCWEAAR